MSDQHTEPVGPPRPEPGRDDGAGHARGWLIAMAIIGVLILGGLAALVIDRGDSGDTANAQPPEVQTIVQQTVRENTVSVQAPPTTVTVTTPTVTSTPTVTAPTTTTP